MIPPMPPLAPAILADTSTTDTLPPEAARRYAGAALRAAARGRLRNPADATAYVDHYPLEVGTHGEVDPAQAAAAIDDLIATRPYLAGTDRVTEFTSPSHYPRERTYGHRTYGTDYRHQ